MSSNGATIFRTPSRLYKAASRRSTTSYSPSAFAAGSLIGFGAATVGLAPFFAGVRLWHVLALTALIYVIYRGGIAAIARIKVTGFDIAFISFIVLSVIVEVADGDRFQYVPDVIGALSSAFYFAAYLAARLCVFTIDSFVRFLKGLIWPAAPVSILGLFQLFNVRPVVEFSLAIAPSAGVDSRISRGSLARAWGLSGYWTGFGAYLTCIVAATVCVILIHFYSTRRFSPAYLTLLVVALVGVVSTLTISVIVASLAIVLIAWRHVGLRLSGVFMIALPLLAASVYIAPFLAGRLDQQFTESWTTQNLPSWIPSTLAYRFIIWQRETIPAINASPLTGWGSGVYAHDDPGRIYPAQLKWLSPESQWFAVGVSAGVPALIAFVLLVLIAGMVFLRVWRRPVRMIYEPFVILWVALVVASGTAPIFTNRGAPSVFWVLVGAVLALSQSLPAQSMSHLLADGKYKNAPFPVSPPPHGHLMRNGGTRRRARGAPKAMTSQIRRRPL